MEVHRILITPLFSAVFFISLLPFSSSQLSSTETRILLQLKQVLENPPSLQQWNRLTNFCTLPETPWISVECSGNHVIGLTIVGNRSSPSQISSSSEETLSHQFSIEAFFTVLTKLSGLQKLSLVHLGLWGSLPAKIKRFRDLEVLNISSNFISGEIPETVSSYRKLTSLVLSDNLLNGTVPDLRTLSVLEELDLRNNGFGPEFPLLGENLVSLLLSNNSFRFEIPAEIRLMGNLQVLDLRSNNLVGRIPSSLFSIPSLLYINLGKNQLTGTFDDNVSCNGNLSYVDISDNLLTGKLPSCLESRTLIVTGNCLSNTGSQYQHPLSFCQQDEALAVQPPATIQKGQSTLKLGVVLGLIGGVAGVLVLVALLVFVILKRARRRRNCEYKHNNGGCGSSIVRNLQESMALTPLGIPPYREFTLEELKAATSNFDPSNREEDDFDDQVYNGRLVDGSTIFVKCMKLKQKHSSLALQQHIEVISKLRHQNLLSVLGYCIFDYKEQPNTNTTLFVVFENIVKMSLRDQLIDWRKRDVLKWQHRMAITMGIARGIQHLHTVSVRGNDLKIENILLDESLSPKISRYNITLPSMVGNNALGRNELEKKDIYGFGVILAELITGKLVRSREELDDLKSQLERSLAGSPSTIGDFIDLSMRGTFANESIKTIVQITVNCLNKDPMKRPTIEDIIWHLQYSVQVQEGWTSNGSLS